MQALEGRGTVTRDETSATVGEVRDAGVRRALARLATPCSSTWVASTDADTTVGSGWLASIIRAAAVHGVVGVVGVTALDRWRGTARGAAAYHELLVSKHHGRDGGLHRHDHVYGANLAVRADAYLDVGGFPRTGHGEDQALVDALAARGHRLLRRGTSAWSRAASPRTCQGGPGHVPVAPRRAARDLRGRLGPAGQPRRAALGYLYAR